MEQYRLLILTDHRKHSAENSLYSLAQAMRIHPRCAQVDVATRGDALNDSFFRKFQSQSLWATKATANFSYSPDGQSYKQDLREVAVENYDLVWLRMPPPLSKSFLDFLHQGFSHPFFINAPAGIYQTGSKEFLMNFPELCPPMKICRSIEDIIAFKNQFPIVLKPFREYGGRGIVKIDGDRVWEGKQETTFDAFVAGIKNKDIAYLGVKFLTQVDQGDKRIVVVNGQVLGASLRLPADGSWICNVAMGGQSGYAEADAAELEIVSRINPVLSKMGIVMYGVDTLMGDAGQRILSEINTTSIGGLPQIAQYSDEPLLENAADLIWNYFIKNTKKDVITKE